MVCGVRRRYTLSGGDRFLALASDGVWEFLDDATVVAMIEHWLNHYDGHPRKAEEACREVCV